MGILDKRLVVMRLSVLNAANTLVAVNVCEGRLTGCRDVSFSQKIDIGLNVPGSIGGTNRTSPANLELVHFSQQTAGRDPVLNMPVDIGNGHV